MATVASEWSGYVQAVTPVDPESGDLSASPWSAYRQATTADLPGVEYWLADGSWRPALLRTLSL